MASFAHQMTAEFTEQNTIRCQLSTTATETLQRPVVCFSLLDACQPVAGCILISSLGGFAEIKLDADLANGSPVEFEIAYAGHGSKTMNRAWMPLGIYLKFADGSTEPVAPLPAGVKGPNSTPPILDCDGLKLVPPPTLWHPGDGTISIKGVSIAENGEFSTAIESVNRLAARAGFGQFLVKGGTPLTITRSDTFSESGYRLAISSNGIEISAHDEQGAFYGAITLLNLMATYGCDLPIGTISDSPRFHWRGQHLDCARHFYQPETLFRLVDMMALLKLNVFHWHFADDEAFRLEIKSRPEAWQKSAFRGEGKILPGLFGGGAGPTGGSYSTEMAKKLIAHAKELHIDVLPEIEVPAHSLALARIYPELRDENDIGNEKSVQSYPENVVNPALSATWDFLEEIVSEISAIFPFAHLHLGADELPENTWNGSPAISKLKARKDLQTAQDVLGCTLERLGQYTKSQGARPCAWEEAAQGKNGGINNGALLFSWTSQGPGLEAARNGYDVVMCPGQHVYLDMAHSDDQDDWGASWAAIIGLRDTVDWEPVPANEPELAARIAGVQGTFWSEFTTIDAQMEPMLAPRILGISAMGWSAAGDVDSDKIVKLATSYGTVFDIIGWDWHRGALDNKSSSGH